MKEIASRGPITAVLNSPPFLDEYEGGILHSISPLDERKVSRISKNNYEYFISSTKSHITSMTLKDQDFEFEYVNHSIVIVGWGYDSEKEVKYWI
mmetsp:Transcript_30154/g.26714  ORF Transcript_30154/g.26714 Transcript_30154/m.26714 type:complete len:95 (-) Transcript_30154:158-442(-)